MKNSSSWSAARQSENDQELGRRKFASVRSEEVAFVIRPCVKLFRIEGKAFRTPNSTLFTIPR